MHTAGRSGAISAVTRSCLRGRFLTPEAFSVQELVRTFYLVGFDSPQPDLPEYLVAPTTSLALHIHFEPTAIRTPTELFTDMSRGYFTGDPASTCPLHCLFDCTPWATMI